MAVSLLKITNRFADIRFMRISAIKNLAGNVTFSSCWATAGVVLDEGATRVSVQGKDYSIWKMGALDAGLMWLDAGHLHTYRFCDNVWTFILIDATVKNEEIAETVSRLKIMACASQLLVPQQHQ